MNLSVSAKSWQGVLNGIALNLLNNFGEIDIVNIVSLQIQEYWQFLCLFGTLEIFLANDLYFSVKFHTYFLYFRHLILLQMVPLLNFIFQLFVVYTDILDFCILTCFSSDLGEFTYQSNNLPVDVFGISTYTKQSYQLRSLHSPTLPFIALVRTSNIILN